MMFKKNSLTICFSILILVGCTTNSSLPVDDGATNTTSKKTDPQCRKIDTKNTTLLASGVVGLVTLNPITTLFAGGLTYFIIDAGVFACDKSE